MSWLDRRIVNKDSSLITPSEEQRAIREVKEEVVDESKLAATPNVVKVGGEKFVCPNCDEGWTFARMRTVVCCGITYVRD
jgi:hypothetical protein